MRRKISVLFLLNLGLPYCEPCLIGDLTDASCTWAETPHRSQMTKAKILEKSWPFFPERQIIMLLLVLQSQVPMMRMTAPKSEFLSNLNHPKQPKTTSKKPKFRFQGSFASCNVYCFNNDIFRKFAFWFPGNISLFCSHYERVDLICSQ